MSNPQQLLSLVSSVKNAAGKPGAMAGNVWGSKSLAEFTKGARISPYVLIEESLRAQPYISDILQAATSIYAGYYLTAVSLLGDVAGVSVLEKLDRINPNREADVIGRASRMAMEDFSLGLPFKDRPHVPGKWSYVQEDNGSSTEVVVTKTTHRDSSGNIKKDKDDNEMSGTVEVLTTKQSQSNSKADTIDSMSAAGKNNLLIAKEASSLACGKLLEVQMVIDGRTLTIPTTVMLFPNTSDTESFAHILSLHEQVNTVRERWHDWRSGKISFWNDFVMMRDIVKKHRKVLLKDKSGYYAAVTQQDRNNKVAASMSGSSLAQASNILVFSTTCARLAEQTIGGSIKNFKVREAVFEKTKAMIMFVVDRDREMVSIYHSGVEMANELSVRELKVANKNSGPDVAEILKAYQLGNAPSF